MTMMVFILFMAQGLASYGVTWTNGDDSLLDILREVDTSSLPECENTVSCVAARLRLSSLLLDHITVVGKTLSKVNQLSEDPESWEYEDNNGTEAVLTWMGDEMYGHINLGHGNMFVIEPTMTAKMLVLKEEDTSTWEDGDDAVEEEVEMRDAVAPAPHLVEQGLADRTTMRAVETNAPPDPDLVRKGKEDKTKLATFTVTVYITKEFKRKVANPKLVIDGMIAMTNQGYINSGALIRIALHCIQETNIGDGQSLSKTLQDFTNLGPAAYIRKSADTALLLVYKFMSGCGKNNFDQIGSGKTLGVSSKECEKNYVFAHEIAHGLGLGHEKSYGESSTDYSHGMIFKTWPALPHTHFTHPRAVKYGYEYGYGKNKPSLSLFLSPGMSYKYRTIMATPRTRYRLVNYYSSPNARYQGITTGTATDDNVRVLNERRFAAAAIGDESFYCQLGITDNTDTETCIRDIYHSSIIHQSSHPAIQPNKTYLINLILPYLTLPPRLSQTNREIWSLVKKNCTDGGMKENCKASCLNEAVCGERNNYESCSKWQQRGECDNSEYKTFMMDHCRASCLCGYLPRWYLKSDCSDKLGTEECQRRAKNDGSGCFSNTDIFTKSVLNPQEKRINYYSWLNLIGSPKNIPQKLTKITFEDSEMATNCKKTCVCNTKTDDWSISFASGKYRSYLSV